MACNHYRAPLEVWEEIGRTDLDEMKEYATQLRFTIGHAPAFMFLPYDAYDQIAHWCDGMLNVDEPLYSDREDIRWILMEILPEIGREWLALGKPITEGDWGRAKYPGTQI